MRTGPREILALVGLIMLFVGLSLWSIAVALSTVGALLLLFAAWPYVAPRRSS
jgi:membrane protein implicated in regulation of membrane protease activity